MPKTESALPADWFAQGDLDIEAAEILLEEGGPSRVVAFHIQQAVEKYLKGYLLSQGWTLRRIHDLEVLIQEAIVRDEAFAPFLEPCQRITEYYIETRYPLGVYTPLHREVLEADLDEVRELVALTRSKLVTAMSSQEEE